MIFSFTGEFDELIRRLSGQLKKIEMVLLGDIFDLIRTQKYYEFEGMPRPEVKLRVMQDITEQHMPFFETLRYFTRKRGNQLRYVIGNHDFGVRLDSRLPEIIRENFGLDLTPESYYCDETLGIWQSMATDTTRSIIRSTKMGLRCLIVSGTKLWWKWSVNSSRK